MATSSLGLSHSSWDMFNSCSFKYYLKYNEHIKPFIPIRYPLVSGVAFHELVNEMYTTQQFDYNFLKRGWKPHFMKALETEGSGFADTTGYEEWLSKGYILIGQFFKFAKANGYLIKPIQSEWGFNIKRNGFRIVGKVDLIIKREQVDFIELLDFKTGWHVPTLEEVRKNRQLTIYDWAIEQELKLGAHKIGLFFPRKCQILHSERVQADYEEMLADFDRMSRAIEEKQFHPNFEHCENCEFKDYCLHFINKNSCKQ